MRILISFWDYNSFIGKIVQISILLKIRPIYLFFVVPCFLCRFEAFPASICGRTGDPIHFIHISYFRAARPQTSSRRGRISNSQPRPQGHRARGWPWGRDWSNSHNALENGGCEAHACCCAWRHSPFRAAQTRLSAERFGVFNEPYPREKETTIMILTFKTLQQQTFKLEVDEKITVSSYSDCTIPSIPPTCILASLPFTNMLFVWKFRWQICVRCSWTSGQSVQLRP